MPPTGISTLGVRVVIVISGESGIISAAIIALALINPPGRVEHFMSRVLNRRLSSVDEGVIVKWVESLEHRQLLSGAAPVAVADSFSTLEDVTLRIDVGETSLFTSYYNHSSNYTAADGSFTASRNNQSGIDVVFEGHGVGGTTMNFSTADASPLVPGLYANAERYGSNTNAPGLAVGEYLYYDDTVSGQFEVVQANYNADGSVKNFAAEFEQHLNGNELRPLAESTTTISLKVRARVIWEMTLMRRKTLSLHRS